jgi:tRNA (guanine26-N2/guanine27-N2)-dimethyltransferase
MPDQDFVEAVEGKTRLLVPRSSLSDKVPPKTPAFFNPSARLNRSMSILAYRAFARQLSKERTFADSFTGVGARALRVAVEVPEIEHIYGNDLNPVAIDAAKKAADLNSIADRCTFSIAEVCKFLTDHATGDGGRFAIIDLDPFGTPAKYIDCLLRAVLDEGLVSVTATDNAVLCGIYPEVCSRRYYGKPLNNSYCNEIAVRLLLSLLALTASRLELSIRPLFAHANIHYFRVYAQVFVSSGSANKVLDNVGYVMHCFHCGNRFLARESDLPCPVMCELCGTKLSMGGQLWAKSLYDKEFVARMASFDPDRECKKLLDLCAEELDSIPYYFKADEISSMLKTNPVSIAKMLEVLKGAGFAASRTAFNTGGFKTDARIDQILNVIK